MEGAKSATRPLAVVRHARIDPTECTQVFCRSTSSSAKTYLVTGSTDGIGRHTAERLLLAGGNVIVHGRSVAHAAFTMYMGLQY